MQFPGCLSTGNSTFRRVPCEKKKLWIFCADDLFFTRTVCRLSRQIPAEISGRHSRQPPEFRTKIIRIAVSQKKSNFLDGQFCILKQMPGILQTEMIPKLFRRNALRFADHALQRTFIQGKRPGYFRNGHEIIRTVFQQTQCLTQQMIFRVSMNRNQLRQTESIENFSD